jgi:hypothetical protein
MVDKFFEQFALAMLRAVSWLPASLDSPRFVLANALGRTQKRGSDHWMSRVPDIVRI